MPHYLFPGQKEGERIYLVVREHWVHLVLKIIMWLFFAVALVLFNRFARAYLPNLYTSPFGPVTLLFTQVYTLFLTLALFLIFVFYYLSIQIITGIRIVDIEQVGLFDHVVSELHIDKIEDVSSKTSGLLGTIFNYGGAGTEEHFIFHNVPNPAGIEKMVLDLYEKNSNFARDTALNTDIAKNTAEDTK
jgi:hypothetical protein